MKKLLGILLAVCLCLSVVIPVSAAAPALSASAASVAPGKTLAVDLDMLNNTGFAYLKVSASDYDTSVFTFDTQNMTNAAVGMTTAIGPLGASWDNTENYVGRDLGTLYFTVADNAAYGSYDITFTADQCFDATQADVAVASFTLRVTVAEPSSGFFDASVSLSEDISVKYFVSLHPEHAGATVRFTMNERETVVTGLPTSVANEYVYEFRGIAPQCMGDSIKAELVLDGEVLDSTDGFTVRAYALALMDSSAAALGMSDEKFAAMKTALADMLNYGAAAQQYRGYKTDALVNAGITGGSSYTEITATKDTSASSHATAAITSIGLYFDYANALYVKFTAPAMTDDNFYILAVNTRTGEEKEYLISDAVLLDEATSTYMLVLDALHLSEYGDTFQISLYAPRSAGSASMKEYQYLEYSAFAYVAAMQNKTENSALTPMAQLARAVYLYAVSANAYGKIAD